MSVQVNKSWTNHQSIRINEFAACNQSIRKRLSRNFNDRSPCIPTPRIASRLVSGSITRPLLITISNSSLLSAASVKVVGIDKILSNKTRQKIRLVFLVEMPHKLSYCTNAFSGSDKSMPAPKILQGLVWIQFAIVDSKIERN